MRLIPCQNCGKITSGRSDKQCCCNACAVKLNYARQHNFTTVYERHVGEIKDIKVEIEEHRFQPISKTSIKYDNDNTSQMALKEAQKKLTEINNLKIK